MTPRVAAVRSSSGAVMRVWLPSGERSDPGYHFDGEQWKAIAGDVLNAACEDASLPLSTSALLQRCGAMLNGADAIAIDTKRQRCWLGSDDAVWMFESDLSPRCVCSVHAEQLLPSPDGQTMFVTSDRSLIEVRFDSKAFEIADADVGRWRIVDTFARPIMSACRTPAGIAVIVDGELIGLNLRTQRHAVITQLPASLHQAALASDHRGNFTLATATSVWTCRADASGLRLEWSIA